MDADLQGGYLDTVVDSSKKQHVVTLNFMAPFDIDKRSEALRTNGMLGAHVTSSDAGAS